MKDRKQWFDKTAKPMDERPEYRFLEQEQIGGKGTYQVNFIHFVGPISAHSFMPIFGILQFLAQSGKIKANGDVEHRFGIYQQQKWDLGGSYLGPVNSQKEK
ncbi:MAG: hypothetical protein JRI53_04490 [Deltaproteobacteria bacterium]|nr:hypothetical protein [Deltaproteobacteria bacterium]